MRIVVDKKETFDNFFDNKNLHRTLLISFSTQWCTPCKKMKRIIEEVDKNFDDVVIVEVDAEKLPEISQSSLFSIFSVPTVFIFNYGNLVERIEGYTSFESFKKFLSF